MNQTPFWIILGAPLLAAFMSLVSTSVAVLGIRMNRLMHADRVRQDSERESRQGEAALAARQGDFYEAMVVTPLKEYLAEFKPRTRETLTAGLKKLEEVRAADRLTVNAAVKKFQKDLRETWVDVKWSFDFGVDSSNDPELKTRVSTIYQKLTDDISDLVNGWAGSEREDILREDEFRQAFSEYATQLTLVTVERDPELRYRQSLSIAALLPAPEPHSLGGQTQQKLRAGIPAG